MVDPIPAGRRSITPHLVVQGADIDTAFPRAVEAGATPTMQPEDTFWGDRFGKLKDPFGHDWAMATHVRDVAPEEMEEAVKKSMGDWDGGGSD